MFDFWKFADLHPIYAGMLNLALLGASTYLVKQIKKFCSDPYDEGGN